MGKYELRVFGEALGAEFPTKHPAVSSAVDKGKKARKSAPAAKTGFILALEKAASDPNTEPGGTALLCVIYNDGSIIFAIRGHGKTQSLKQSQTSMWGMCVGPENRPGELTAWAKPLKGVTGEVGRSKPIIQFWGGMPNRTLKPRLAIRYPRICGRAVPRISSGLQLLGLYRPNCRALKGN